MTGTQASTIILAPALRAVGEARAFVRTLCLEAGVEEDALETAVLLTSETVTNAFVHGRSDARLVVTVDPDRILVQVGDKDSHPPEIVDQLPGAVSGRGLMILDSLAARWGIIENANGKVVWFEVKL